ncbi:LysR family transcriptional regulator [Pyxidicoccus fallax]|uniref:LysR family transcriptional regulator n=1 Tax=Pyxidicoccus fallax TaxID=394095 RepID=A0A848L5X5_9BACT|nr:LysR substrate-binding domain-containing protein [Pyxidicoccus fallax]NMO13682.1 LysR family transcriptional regulator [Pyxidicoccus fallax]NPC76830.1 LysR family transcriptional regulator [Pyxidicoccus fallax]
MTSRAEWLPALAAFESAARHQNFARAAEELHLTASAVSHHVRRLESLLGVALFQRHARGVSLTAEGRLLADTAGSAMSSVDDVLRGLSTSRDEKNRVRITTLHSLTYTWLLPRLPRFAAAHPHIRIHVDTAAALTRFDEGGPDLGIRYGDGHWPGLTALHLMSETIFPVAAPTLPGFRDVREAADVAKLPLVADLAHHGWPDWFRAAGVRGAPPDERYNFSDTTDAVKAAVHGLGAALGRDKIITPYLADGRLVRLPGPAMPARPSYYVVYPAHQRLRPAARAFIDWVMKQPEAPAPV